ncbi:conserved hypothetical protein [Histoplasma capsulatum var. duboisii H88]|uniref:Uncharacterized protein n=1 Tax=Ajellomyces capsulatus (strain H88) TaxID=544711 RepID=F0UFD1_AJEC8|nr:conserved hypothetical protein [Histoplasma capsulatum var. duboisii H88]
MAQNQEYIIIQWKKNKLQKDNKFPPKKLFKALKNEIRMERFQKLQRSTLTALPGIPINKDETSKALLHYGINSIHRLREELVSEYHYILKRESKSELKSESQSESS